MSFLYYRSGDYVFFDPENSEIAVRRDTLIFTFLVYGYLRCPVRKAPMSDGEIRSLLKITDSSDPDLSALIRQYYSYNCDIENRRNQLNQLSLIERKEAGLIFQHILAIGMIMLGWNDITKPLPETIQSEIDVVHAHLAALPFVKHLNNSPIFHKVKKFGIYGDFCNSGYTIENAFQDLNNPQVYEITRRGKQLVTTANFYLKNFYEYYNPEVERLILRS